MQVVQCRFTAEQVAWLKAEHEKTGRMTTEIVRRVLDHYIEHHTPAPTAAEISQYVDTVFNDSPSTPPARQEETAPSLAAGQGASPRPSGQSRFSRGVKIRRR